jgi:hypothetical protein
MNLLCGQICCKFRRELAIEISYGEGISNFLQSQYAQWICFACKFVVNFDIKLPLKFHMAKALVISCKVNIRNELFRLQICCKFRYKFAIQNSYCKGIINYLQS